MSGVVCMKCQTPAAASGGKFCTQCGEILPTSLLETTAATRTFIDSASAAEKADKKGQQKWGLFETNYQRTKGISTAESMNEIEEFARTGVRPEATPGTVPWTPKTGGGGAGDASSSSSVSSKFMAGGSAGSSTAGSSTSTSGSIQGTAFFPKGDDEGTKLFAKYEAGKKKINPTPYTGKKWSTPGTQQ